MNGCDVFKDFIAPIVGWAIIVVGWVVVSKGNNTREERKEIRSIINDIRNRVLEIESLASEYYQLPAESSASQALLLKRQIKHLSMLVGSVTQQNPKFDLAVPLADFRGKITGGDFESIMRAQRPPGDPLISDVAVAAHDFLDSVEAIFAREYSGK